MTGWLRPPRPPGARRLARLLPRTWRLILRLRPGDLLHSRFELGFRLRRVEAQLARLLDKAPMLFLRRERGLGLGHPREQIGVGVGVDAAVDSVALSRRAGPPVGPDPSVIPRARPVWAMSSEC